MTILTKSGVLGPGQSQQVPFQVNPHEPGNYTITVNGLTGAFTAVKEQKPQMFYGYVRTHTGLPIPDALIQVYYKAAVFTNTEGYYEVKELPEGFYTIVCYAQSYFTGSARAMLEEGKATEVNFTLYPYTGPIQSLAPPRRIIYCGVSPHTPTVLLGGRWEVVSDEGYADNIREWLRDPSIEYAYIVADHGSSSELWLRGRGSSRVRLSYLHIREELANRQPFKLVFLSGCNTVDVGGSQLAYAFGGSALGQSKPYFRASGIQFFNLLNSGLSAYQSYVNSGADVTYGTVGLLTYYGDTRPGFRLV